METKIVNGVPLAYVDRGTGPALVLVHGFPLDHTMWAGQIDALAGEFRVIAPDLRGFGQSGGSEATVPMAQFADDVAGLLDALGVDQPVVLCGLSMGGYIALQFWHRHAARLRGLVLCDTRASADTPAAVAGRHAMIDRVAQHGAAPVAEQMIPKLFAAATAEDRPEVIGAVRSTILATDPLAIAAAVRGMAERPDMVARLPQIACPTLVLVGREDVLSPPEEMRGMAQAIPGARFVEIAGGGHLAPMERPVEATAALRAFLADARPRGF